MNGNWSRAVPVISAIVSLITLALLVLTVAVWFYSIGNLQARVDELARDQAEMRQEMRDGFDRVDVDLKELREELRLTTEEVRVSRSEIIAAIQEHEHDDQGRVVFRRPY